jgi:hypothetical protein
LEFCWFREKKSSFGLKLLLVLRPNQNYQAMLMTEPLNTANIVDVPADLSTPFDYLTNSDTDADNADLYGTRWWA